MNKLNLNKIYNKRFFARRYKLSWRDKPLCDAVINTFGMKSGDKLVDVGCATGEFIAEFRRSKVKAFGIEGSLQALEYLNKEAEKYIEFFDLRSKLFNVQNIHHSNVLENVPYNIVLCLEVAEHIEKEHCDQFVKNLVSLSDLIVISAAPPNQGGHYHVNCQEYKYWEEKFKEHDYKRSEAEESEFKRRLSPWKKKKGLNAYYANTLVFRKI